MLFVIVSDDIFQIDIEIKEVSPFIVIESIMCLCIVLALLGLSLLDKDPFGLS